MRCTICGYEFEQEQLTCHAACPLGAGCMVICCPRSGYSTVDPQRAGLARWAQRFFKRQSRSSVHTAEERGVRLIDLEPGEEGQIAEIGGEAGRLSQLSHYGLVPGTPIRLCQKRPVPIVQVGHTDLALDEAVARQIFVRREA